jgi:hypothetical protein
MYSICSALDFRVASVSAVASVAPGSSGLRGAEGRPLPRTSDKLDVAEPYNPPLAQKPLPELASSPGLPGRTSGFRV